MQDAVAADDGGVRIAEEGVRPAGLGEMRARRRRRIDADRDRLDAACREVGKPFLETP
jgi:hypothetical protein